MSSRRKSDQCRICGGALQGNQRRWLFGGHSRKSQPQTPTGSVRARSRNQSANSSPWGSTASLGSSVSLSKSHLSPNSSKSFDLLSVLTHILGRPVSRCQAQGEFICGKCVSILERVFKFDTVIARVRVLSSERLQKLTQERDKIRQWVRHSYREKNPQDAPSRGSTSEEDGESEKDGYREMLKENMALSEYECWSERWDTCPYFIRTGKRCRKGKGCEGCDALRVSDSDYESVCGVPRHLPFQSFSPLSLSRDRSQSMPLHWNKVSSVCSSPASFAGSTLSLPASSSRTESTQSLDSLDGNDEFETPPDETVNVLLKELRNIERKAVSSPAGSRIPVLGRREGRSSGGDQETAVNRVLNFGDGVGNGGDEDALTELRDEFVPLHGQNGPGRVHHVVRLLRGQLDQALARVRTLEDQLQRDGTKADEVDGSNDWTVPVGEDGGVSLLRSLGLSLRSRERLIQECMGVIRRLCSEEGKGSELAEKLNEKLSESLKDTLSENRAALNKLSSDLSEEKQRLQEEVEALRKAARDRERDLDTLNAVLQCNQDVINELRVSLGEKEQQLKAFHAEREVSAHRERALNAALSDKDALLLCLKQELDNCQKDVEALSDSVIGQRSSGDGTEALVSRLKDKETEVAAVIKGRVENSATMCQEVTKLTTALQQYQSLVQSQQESHSQTLSSLTNQLNETRKQLRDTDTERKEANRVWQKEREDNEQQQRKLQESLDKRDKLIEQILQDAEEQEHLFRELQQNLQNKFHPATGFKHTL